MFSGFMVNAWTVASIVAVVAGLVGFFVVLRGSAFVAHAVPNGSFAGAAGAFLLGVNTLFGLGAFSMLGLGALFLNLTVEYSSEVYSLLFGEVLGISSNELAPTVALALVCVAAIA